MTRNSLVCEKIRDQISIFANVPSHATIFRNKGGCDEKKWWNRELTLKCKLKCCVKPMKDPLGVSPSKGNQGTTRGKEKIILTSVGPRTEVYCFRLNFNIAILVYLV